MKQLQQIIEKSWQNKQENRPFESHESVQQVMSMLEKGELRVAEKKDGKWLTNEWIKKAILLYFLQQPMKEFEAGDLKFFDKIPLKTNFKELNIRAVPHAMVRYGSYIAPGVILMPSYVNVGAYVDSGSMVDTWATVGSCAQIGKNVHLSGGVGIGGVLEPPQAAPVIIEDGCFIGSRAIIVEGVHVEKEVVIAANVSITRSTKIIDVTSDTPREYKAIVPARSVVIPGTYTKQFPAGEYQVSCALIIGKRKESTDLKTSLNQVLRDFDVQL